MSMRGQREYGMSSASTHLRPVDLRLRTMGLWDCFQNHGCALQTLFLLIWSSRLFWMRQDVNGSRGYFATG